VKYTASLLQVSYSSSVVSKAFQILSDPQKRAVFDQSGSDPESRSSGRSHPFASNGAMSPFGEGELSPEDLFNMFFGNGFAAQAGFGGPGQYHFYLVFRHS
jgi:DnaJ homolog subfamily B member 12